MCSEPLWNPEREDSPMYLYCWPWSLHGQHSNMYPIPSVVHLGMAIVSSLAGLGGGGCPGPGTGLSESSVASISLPLQGRQPPRPHWKDLAQGLLAPNKSMMVWPPHLSINFTPGLFKHSPKVSSSVWRDLLRVESLVKGTKTGDSTTLTLLP